MNHWKEKNMSKDLDEALKNWDFYSIAKLNGEKGED